MEEPGGQAPPHPASQGLCGFCVSPRACPQDGEQGSQHHGQHPPPPPHPPWHLHPFVLPTGKLCLRGGGDLSTLQQAVSAPWSRLPCAISLPQEGLTVLMQSSLWGQYLLSRLSLSLPAGWASLLPGTGGRTPGFDPAAAPS